MPYNYSFKVAGLCAPYSFTIKELSLKLDVQKAHKTALKLHAHSVLYAHKLSTT